MESNVVFKGFFTNPDYNDLENLSKVSDQTKLNEEQLLEIKENIEFQDDIEMLFNIFIYIKANFKWGEAPKFSRSATEIYDSKILSGCNDFGLVTNSILKSFGIPTVYVKSAHMNWIKDLKDENEKSKGIRGHNFLEVYLSEKWLLFDATNGRVYDNYNVNDFSLPNNYYAFAKSRDIVEVGIKDLRTNCLMMTEIFKKTDYPNYKNPDYLISLKEESKSLTK